MTEDQLNQEMLGWLSELDYKHTYGPDIAPDGKMPECSNCYIKVYKNFGIKV